MNDIFKNITTGGIPKGALSVVMAGHKTYDYVVYLGRFEPFHDGHYATLRQAISRAKKKVLLGIGSANRSRSTDQPFTYDERVHMITRSLHETELDLLEFFPVNDYPYNDDAWMMHVTNQVTELIGEKQNIALIGLKKDESSRYLDWFPQWGAVSVDEMHGVMSATDVRNQYFRKGPIISEFVPYGVKKFLKEFYLTKEYKWLLNEFDYIREYPKLWGKGPFITVDAVVLQMGHVLLVTRKEAPFKGKLAIPGGFVNLNEWIAKARIRELKEETRLADLMGEIPPAKIHSFLVKEKVYDDPKRSARGRVITFAGLYKLPSAKQLYTVVGSDDAEKAEWYNLSDLNASMFMEDHYFIIQDMLGVTEGV